MNLDLFYHTRIICLQSTPVRSQLCVIAYQCIFVSGIALNVSSKKTVEKFSLVFHCKSPNDYSSVQIVVFP